MITSRKLSGVVLIVSYSISFVNVPGNLSLSPINYKCFLQELELKFLPFFVVVVFKIKI